MTGTDRWSWDAALLELLTEAGVRSERVQAGAYLVHLTGEQRRSTQVYLIVGDQALSVEAFVLHVLADGCPDPAALHRHLLRRNLRLREVHYAVDDTGDVFLVGAVPLDALTGAALDRVLGEVLATLDQDQQRLLTLTFGERHRNDPALAAKVAVDGAGRRPADTPAGAPRRDSRR